MGCYLFCVFMTILVHNAFGLGPPRPMCSNNTQQRARSCTTQILDEKYAFLHADACQVELIPSESAKCKEMNFRPIESNPHIGGVILKPYIMPVKEFSDNYTVLNISFSKIKWKTMKFRFQTARQKKYENYCRNIVLSHNVSVDDQSILYYDCYWSITSGNCAIQRHVLDFEAEYDGVINRGRYFFNVPTSQMLSPTVTEEKWQPFIYVEILTSSMRLHIMPPPDHLNITGYQIKVMKKRDKRADSQKQATIELKNKTDETTYDYSLLVDGSHYFVVTPLHQNCPPGGARCISVESAMVSLDYEKQTLNICIVSVMALVVATLFAYYIVLRLIKRHCLPKTHLPIENYPDGDASRIMVVYSPSNSIHAECVDSFVNLLRKDYGLSVVYDADIAKTPHKDPFIWAMDEFEKATHILYIVSPAESNIFDIYDTPIANPHQKIDTLVLVRLQNNAVSKNRKLVSNVFFEHSKGPVPIETKMEKSYHLLKDWNKLITYLTTNRSPKKLIGRTEVGQIFLDDLRRARKMLSATGDFC